MKSIKEKLNKTFETLKPQFGYKNVMAAPRLVKAVISVGTGSFKDKKKNEVVVDRLAKITGQKPAARAAKKAVASYKTRQGDVIGYQVTLRGPRMLGFMEKLLNISLPRTKDFRGISQSAIDDMGNLTIGIREHTIFPETSDEDLRDVFGMAVTVVTTAKNGTEAKAFLEHLGFPFQKLGSKNERGSSSKMEKHK